VIEFSSWVNRRYFKDGFMERILVASVNHKWDYLG